MISFPSKYQKTELCSTPCCFAGCFGLEVAGNVETDDALLRAGENEGEMSS
jgi:hypothetical protein